MHGNLITKAKDVELRLQHAKFSYRREYSKVEDPRKNKQAYTAGNYLGVRRVLLTGTGESLALNMPSILLASTGLMDAATTLIRT
jgi:hypothetical protein